MWLVLGMFLGAAFASPCFALLYLGAKPFHVGADVDGLACNMHRPMDCG
jgi:hypothetical protein